MKRTLFLFLLLSVALAGCKKNPAEPAVYSNTVTAGVNGTVSADMVQAAPGTTVTLTATPAEGYQLALWTVTSGNTTVVNPRAASTKFSMPAGDVTITASFALPGSGYSITVTSGAHGNAVADMETAEEGTLVTLTANPHPGFELAGWSVTSGNVTLDKPNGDPATFLMPAGDVEIASSYSEIADFDVYSVVTDRKFLEYLKGAGFDADNNGRLSMAEAADVFEIRAPYDSAIASLAGVECFYNIGVLSFAGNNVTEVDLTPFAELVSLDFNTNDITAIDTSKNPLLGRVVCYDNQLSELDLSHNPELDYLRCYGNRLTALDLSANTKLRELDCSGNDIATLTLPATDTFVWLQCNGNELTELDVTQCPKLGSIMCQNNRNLGSLDVTQNPLLTGLSCSNCGLAELDLTQNGELSELLAGENEFTALDLSGNPKMLRMSIGGNNFSSIDLDDVPLLENLNIDNNQLTSLDVSGNTKLYLVNCSNNQLASFRASETLSFLQCGNNRLTSFSVAEYPRLNTLECHANLLTTLDASTMPRVEFDGYYWLFCGQQKTATGGDQNLTLTLAQEHFSMWNTAQQGYEALKNYPENSNITLQIKE
jgi:hypothetical protein